MTEQLFVAILRGAYGVLAKSGSSDDFVTNQYKRRTIFREAVKLGIETVNEHFPSDEDRGEPLAGDA